MDDELGAPRNRRMKAFVYWLGAAAAVAAIIGLAFDATEWFDTRATPAPTTSAAAVLPGSTSTPAKKAAGHEQFIQPEQCVRNVGDDESPVLEAANCGAGTLRVLARIEQVIDGERQLNALCAEKAPGFTQYHYSNWSKRSDYLDIAFCLGPA